jgi:hypothetical protein
MRPLTLGREPPEVVAEVEGYSPTAPSIRSRSRSA